MGPKNLILIFCWIVGARGHEFHSSTDQLAGLIENEEELLMDFSLFIEEVEDYLQSLKSVHQLYILQRTDLVMTDPLATYKLMKRLRAEWKTIFEYTKLIPLLGSNIEELLELQQIPDLDDLDGAASGIITLQEMYKLYPRNITTDPLTGESIHCSVDESFDLGRTAYKLEKFQLAFLWFLECFYQMKEGEYTDITWHQVLYYLGSSAYHFGDLRHAIYFAREIVNQDPSNWEATITLITYKRKLSTHTSNPDILTLDKTAQSPYHALCRGEAVKMKSRRKRQLSCRYSTGGGNPRLMFAPVKEEEEWDEPRIIRYHDIVSDREMELLKNLSSPRLERSQITSEDGRGKVSYYRVSQSAALSDESHPVVSRVNQRLSDITGLDMESADLLEVSNYGIGGYFGPHYDSGDDTEESTGQRIATIVIYMSDVSFGGSTVFPQIGASLKPQKGTAVMWYNLLRNGRLDEQSQHAGCPVFLGSKWIATKWVREQGQEFRRRCALSETE